MITTRQIFVASKMRNEVFYVLRKIALRKGIMNRNIILKSRLLVKSVRQYNNGVFFKSYCNLYGDSVKQIFEKQVNAF